VVNGTTYDESNPTGTELMTTVFGCDSTVTINLVFLANLEGEETYTGCEGDGYSVIVNGTVYDESNPTGTETITGTGCDSIVTINLVFNPIEQAFIDPQGPVCTSYGILTLTATPPGGVWSGAVNSNQFDPLGLGVGTHEVIYTTASGPCQSADTIEIVVYELTLSCLTLTNESAQGAFDGEGQITISGGVPPYDVDWSGPVSGSVTVPADGDFVITSLTQGVYTVEVEDAQGCMATCEFIITSPEPCELSIDGVIIQDATCPGVSNGSITVNASSTMPPIEYAIDAEPFGSNNVFTGLAPGQHTITVRDAAGCEVEQLVNVGSGLGPNLNLLEIVNASCGLDNGSIEVEALGGSSPYNYSIDGITYVLSGLFNGLGAGSYDIYLIDDGGCTDTLSADVLATDAPVIDGYTIQGSSCGQSDGSIMINASQGVPPYMFSINGGGSFQSSNFFDNLPAGVYPIVVEDAAGCIVNGTASIQDIGAPVITSIVATPTSCGTFDGTVTVNATGTAPLTYSFDGDPFVSSNFFNNVPAGSYTITVRDGNGCLTSEVVVVNTTNGPQITDVNFESTTCGEENGSIEIIASGGTGELTYCIDGPVSDCNDNGEFFDLPAGDYDITVEDENGCTAESQVTIDPSIGPDFDVYITPAHCGLANGCIELDGTEGVPPFTYSMNGASGPFGPVFEFCNKVSDFYLVAIKDAQGCIYEEEVFLWEEDAPEIQDINITNPGCGETTGSIEIIADGVGDLMYSIQTPPLFQDENVFDNVLPGTYTVTVRDEWGCTDTGTATITANPSPVLNLAVTNTPCGEDEGVITATATGGLTPYTYSLNFGAFGNGNVFTGLAAGTYTVIVRGTNNCQDTAVATIISVGTQFGDLSASVCVGDTFFIHGEEFSDEGTYQVDVPGGATNGCDSILNVTLTHDPLIASTIQVTICANEVYTYNGTDYSVPGIYLLDTVPAATGCDTIVTLDLSVDPLETAYIDVTICDGGVYTIGGIDYTVAGEYLIDTVAVTPGCDSARILRLEVVDEISVTIQEFICEGDTFTINGTDYTVSGSYIIGTIPGPNSCDTIVTLELEVNPVPSADAGADQLLDCDVQSVTLNGSAMGGTPLWTGPDIDAGNETQLQPDVSLPGLYILTVTSGANCVDVDSVMVNLDPETVIANAGIDDSLSCDVTEITLQASPVGTDYEYQWTGPGINASNEHLPNPTISLEGVYTLVVTNTVTGCVSAPDEVTISDISVVIIAIIQDPDDFTCYVDTVGLEAVGSSSGPNIVYSWFDQEGNLLGSSPGLEISSGGMFTLIVEDTVSGCFGNDSVFVDDLTQYPQVDAGPPQTIDCNNPTAILNEGAVNNNPNLVFNWEGPVNGIIGPDNGISAVAGIPDNYYYLYVMDTLLGCQNYDSVFINDLTTPPVADIDIVEIITCIDESALLNIGTSSTGQDIIHTWSGPGINNVNANTIEPTQPGQYYLHVTNDATGCDARDSADLVLPMEPQDLLAEVLIPICAGDTSGAITINNVIGGTPDYMYALDGGPLQSSPVFDGIMAGNYVIQIVDANGCTYSESITVADGLELSIDIGPDIELELGDSVILWADVSLPWSQIDSIVWTPLDILSCSYCQTPTLYGLHNETVTATVYTSGCVDQDMLNVRVDVDANIYIPNVFSPNDDGINDHVTVFTDHRVRKIVYLEIFDRWGNQVFIGENFEPNDPLKGWDGSFRGKKMNPAVFVYIAKVELINGDTVDRKGDITIVR
jgi:gliding motility-associated-like protein